MSMCIVLCKFYAILVWSGIYPYIENNTNIPAAAL